MKRAAAGVVVGLLLGLHFGGWYVGIYGRPGMARGGVYVSAVWMCSDTAFELWGRPGLIREDDC